MDDMVLDRIKADSEAILRSWEAEVNPSLPRIEDLSEVTPRSAEDVASRICGLAYVVEFGFGAPADQAIQNLKAFDLWNSLSQSERDLLEAGAPDKQQLVNCTWLAEGIAALMWVIGRAELHHDRQCDDNLSHQIPRRVDPTHFIRSARRRSLSEIQQMVDLLYRLHWYTRNCRLAGKDCRFDEGLVWEHRRAIDWAYGVEADWDEIPSDT
jgi:hypothetical protein